MDMLHSLEHPEASCRRSHTAIFQHGLSGIIKRAFRLPPSSLLEKYAILYIRYANAIIAEVITARLQSINQNKLSQAYRKAGKKARLKENVTAAEVATTATALAHVYGQSLMTVGWFGSVSAVHACQLSCISVQEQPSAPVQPACSTPGHIRHACSVGLKAAAAHVYGQFSMTRLWFGSVSAVQTPQFSCISVQEQPSVPLQPACAVPGHIRHACSVGLAYGLAPAVGDEPPHVVAAQLKGACP